jgi:hypothetical protein
MDGYEFEWNETNDDGSLTSTINTCECNPELCRLKSNGFLRTIIIIIQSIFIVLVAILAAIVFQRRKTKIIKHSMWILLELVLLGAVLLYASVRKLKNSIETKEIIIDFPRLLLIVLVHMELFV